MIWEAPNILIIHLKRFKKTMYGDSEKINNMITFPINGLDITKYVHPLSENKNNLYESFFINIFSNY